MELELRTNEMSKAVEPLISRSLSAKYVTQSTKFRLSEVDRIEYENIYDLFVGEEKNISAREIGGVMLKLGIHCSKEELEDMIEVVDKDGYGLINKKSFMSLITQKVKETSQDSKGQLYESAFKIFDQSGDGMLSKADIRSIMLNIGEKVCDGEVEEMLTASNLTESCGGMTYDNFMRLLRVA